MIAHLGAFRKTNLESTVTATMAASKSKTAPIGSTPWIQTEREQAGQFVDQEVEEFSFSVRNELEWLNEHMGEIFSNSAV